MMTDELIQSLASDVKRVPSHAVGRRIALGMIGGAVVTLLMITALLGVRPDLGSAIQGFAFWMKWGYTASLGMVAVIATATLARPDAANCAGYGCWRCPSCCWRESASRSLRTHRPESRLPCGWERPGECARGSCFCCRCQSSLVCCGRIVDWLQRVYESAGATAGLSAGAWAATLYCLHCPEVFAIFVLTWYSLGIALATGSWRFAWSTTASSMVMVSD